MSDTTGNLQNAVGKMAGLASDVAQRSREIAEQAGALKQSLLELFERAGTMDDVLDPAPVRMVWRKYYPQGVYPVAADWDAVRRALEGGAVVLADVGPNETSLHAVRVYALAGEGEPANADILPYGDADNRPKVKMCPLYAKMPKLAIWSLTIFGTRELGA